MPSTSSEGSSTDRRSRSSSSTTKIYQDITYIIEQPEEKEEVKEKETPSQEKIKPKEKGLTGITGRAVSDTHKYPSLIGGLIVIIIVIVGLAGYLFITKKK